MASQGFVRFLPRRWHLVAARRAPLWAPRWKGEGARPCAPAEASRAPGLGRSSASNYGQGGQLTKVTLGVRRQAPLLLAFRESPCLNTGKRSSISQTKRRYAPHSQRTGRNRDAGFLGPTLTADGIALASSSGTWLTKATLEVWRGSATPSFAGEGARPCAPAQASPAGQARWLQWSVVGVWQRAGGDGAPPSPGFVRFLPRRWHLVAARRAPLWAPRWKRGGRTALCACPGVALHKMFDEVRKIGVASRYRIDWTVG
jgi:hypothetical protein